MCEFSECKEQTNQIATVVQHKIWPSQLRHTASKQSLKHWKVKSQSISQTRIKFVYRKYHRCKRILKMVFEYSTLSIRIFGVGDRVSVRTLVYLDTGTVHDQLEMRKFSLMFRIRLLVSFTVTKKQTQRVVNLNLEASVSVRWHINMKVRRVPRKVQNCSNRSIWIPNRHTNKHFK